MSQASYKKERLPLAPPLVRLVREAALYLISAAALYLMVALVTFHALDPSWSHAGGTGAVRNAGGHVGAWVSDMLYVAFGYVAFIFPAMLGYAAWRMLRHSSPALDRRARLFGAVGFLLTVSGGCGLADLAMERNPLKLPFSAGGLFGHAVGGFLRGALGPAGATIVLLALFFSGVTLFTRLSWLAVMDRTGALLFAGAFWARDSIVSAFDRIQGHKARLERRETVARERKAVASRPSPRVEPVIRPEPGERVER
ncbi:MAG: DNA translocase FtsK 4TM domain-containing protein, partial [Acidiferrobacteraceae bacterium]